MNADKGVAGIDEGATRIGQLVQDATPPGFEYRLTLKPDPESRFERSVVQLSVVCAIAGLGMQRLTHRSGPPDGRERFMQQGQAPIELGLVSEQGQVLLLLIPRGSLYVDPTHLLAT